MQVGERHIVKVFNTRFYPAGLAMWQVEAAAYHSMRTADAQQAQQAAARGGSGSGTDMPSLLCCGLLPDPALRSSNAGSDPAALADTATTAAAPAADAQLTQQQPAAAALPYLVVSKVQGVTLGSLQQRLSPEQWRSAAAAVGRALASFHALPLPGQLPASGTDAPASPAEQQGGCGCGQCCGSPGGLLGMPCTAWTSHSSHVWSSLLGSIDKRAWAAAAAAVVSPSAKQYAAQQQQQQQPGEGGGSSPPGLPATLCLFPSGPLGTGRKAVAADTGSAVAAAAAESSAAAAVGPAAKRPRLGPGVSSLQPAPAPTLAAGGPGSAIADSTSPAAAAAVWDPFLAHLRHRRRKAVRGFEWSGALPPHLVQQLDSYLPQVGLLAHVLWWGVKSVLSVVGVWEVC